MHGAQHRHLDVLRAAAAERGDVHISLPTYPCNAELASIRSTALHLTIMA